MTHTIPARPGFIRELDEERCLALIASATVGRVAFVGTTGQQLLPVNFSLIDGTIYFQVAPDHVLAEMGTGLDDVAFGVEHRENMFQTAWSVVVSGSTSTVEDAELIERIINVQRLRPWAPGDRSLVVALTPRSISGRRVSQH